MLGLDGALEASGSARFGQGSGQILLTQVACYGTEDNLADCIHRCFGDWSYCGHDRDACAVCYSGDPLQVRLAGGSNDAEGRVEVMHDGSWGIICDYGWDLRDASVVCRMLGYDGALKASRTARFGRGSGRILLNYVNCEGTEDNLADCAHPGIGRYTNLCTHSRDAGAVCYSGSMMFTFSLSISLFLSSNPDPLQVRLAGGSNEAEGRVEVLHDGSWGTICDDWWDLRDARVVCRMLGFDGALEAPRSARFGQGSGRVLLMYVNCEGTEDNLADCAHAGIGRYSCSHARDAGAICYSGANPNPFKVRLAGGSNGDEGRVEIMHDGSWGTICDHDWDFRDARVVCTMLGFDGALEAPISARFGQGSGRVLLTFVNCEGTEDNLADCAHAGIGHYSCSHSRDAGAVCYSEGRFYPFSIRLINGTNDSEGRVKVLYKGGMGTICDDNWDLLDARVVCNMLGFDGALATPGRATFGAGSGKILLDDVDCKGTEDSLADCFHRGLGVNNCNHDSDAGVVCFRRGHSSQIQVRLVGGGNDAEGTVNVMLNGSWGTVCDFNWDLRDARVVCRMLGFGGALEAPRSARFGQGSGRILLNWVECDGSEDTLADCIHPGIGDYSYCGHNKDAGVVCFLGVRLADGASENEGRVEILVEGSWGTVCDDLWDLDDATVVCRHLGFVGALAALPQAYFGEGSGDILLDGVQCNGSEANLKDCKHKGIGVHNCAHKEDAGVICRDTGNLKLWLTLSY
ncbi:deleted in malignant brain tumors 1 protein-like [Lytechinus pictus]|uniref:deleted in malignant brain tumors 1 protein-like n=1 Tax=Lytechinus pictus TaxID=7653 RepID=UPI0030BA09B6